MRLLDTNIVSALMRGDLLVVERLASKRPQDVQIPQPVAAEIQYGLSKLAISRRRTTLEAALVTRNVRHFDRVADLTVEDWTA
jgi:predicted nucleic acid-binding protein